jgi:hypothetical protein
LAYLLAAGDAAVLVGVVALPTGLVVAFTTAFVVPTMAIEDRGVLGGWRRFWTTLVGAPKQFVAYAVAIAVIGYVGGILVFLVALLALIPGLIVGGLLGLLVGVLAPPVGIAVAAAVAGTAATIALLVARALFQAFVRYYALFVLGDVDDDLDFIPERRRAVRSGEGAGGDPGDEADSPGDDERRPAS